MDAFMANLRAMDHASKRAKLSQIVGFLYQQNAPVQAEAFNELRACYPLWFPIRKEDVEFREFIAWSGIEEHHRHPLVRQILAQG